MKSVELTSGLEISISKWDLLGFLQLLEVSLTICREVASTCLGTHEALSTCDVFVPFTFFPFLIVALTLMMSRSLHIHFVVQRVDREKSPNYDTKLKHSTWGLLKILWFTSKMKNGGDCDVFFLQVNNYIIPLRRNAFYFPGRKNYPSMINFYRTLKLAHQMDHP